MEPAELTLDLLTSDGRRLLESLCHALPEKSGCWLVGGALRDLVEGVAPQDLDFAVSGSLTAHLQHWAREEGGHWFWLDRQRDQSRVVFKRFELSFDFSALRAATIEEDLRLRDFTLNAMALPLLAFMRSEMVLIDPLRGRFDLRQGVLRSCGPQVLQQDPLRVLKGIRHFARRGWRFEEETYCRMRQAVSLLPGVAAERVRNELGLILASSRLPVVLPVLIDLAILPTLGLPVNPSSVDFGRWAARLEALEYSDFYRRIFAHEIEEGFSCKALMTLAMLIGPVEGRVRAQEYAYTLRLSRRNQSIITALCGEPLADPSTLLAGHSQRLAALLLERFAPCPVERILFSLMQREDAELDMAVADCLRAFQTQEFQGRIPDLLSGKEIVARYNLLPGPAVGLWQQRIKDAEIKGEISDRPSALDWLDRQFSN